MKTIIILLSICQLALTQVRPPHTLISKKTVERIEVTTYWVAVYSGMAVSAYYLLAGTGALNKAGIDKKNDYNRCITTGVITLACTISVSIPLDIRLSKKYKIKL